MLTDNDKITLKKTLQIPLTPDVMKYFGYEKRGNHTFGNNQIFYQDPHRSYIKFREVDTETKPERSKIFCREKQRYCYVVRLELYTISSSPVYTLYTVQDLKMFQKVLKDLEEFESEVKKRTLEIVEPIDCLKK